MPILPYHSHSNSTSPICGKSRLSDRFAQARRTGAHQVFIGPRLDGRDRRGFAGNVGDEDQRQIGTGRPREAQGLQSACRLALGTPSCPTFTELVGLLDWFAPTQDIRVKLVRCVTEEGVHLDKAEWTDAARGMDLRFWFYAQKGTLDSVRANIWDYEPGHQLCCRGSGTGSAVWDPHEVGGATCVEEVPYGPEDFE